MPRPKKQDECKTLNELLEALSVEQERHTETSEQLLKQIDELLGYRFED